MDFDDDKISQEATEIGSDELHSDDNLHLPIGANPLVRLHAVRAWLTRRQKMTNIEIGEVALELQQLQRASQVRPDYADANYWLARNRCSTYKRGFNRHSSAWKRTRTRRPIRRVRGPYNRWRTPLGRILFDAGRTGAKQLTSWRK